MSNNSIPNWKSFHSPSRKAQPRDEAFEPNAWKSSMRPFQQKQMLRKRAPLNTGGSIHTVPFSMFDFHSKFWRITCIWAGLHFTLINKQTPRSSWKCWLSLGMCECWRIHMCSVGAINSNNLLISSQMHVFVYYVWIETTSRQARDSNGSHTAANGKKLKRVWRNW